MIHDIKIIQENNIRRRQIYSLNQQQDHQEFPPFRSSPHVSDSELPVRFADTYIFRYIQLLKLVIYFLVSIIFR